MENRKNSLRTVSNTELWIKETGKEAARVPFVNGIARAGGVCVRMCEESDGTVVPVLSVDDEVSLDYAEIRYRFRKCFLTGDVRMFNNATSTNDIVTVERCNRQTKIKIKDVIVLRNMDRDQTVTQACVCRPTFDVGALFCQRGGLADRAGRLCGSYRCLQSYPTAQGHSGGVLLMVLLLFGCNRGAYFACIGYALRSPGRSARQPCPD